MKLLKNIKRIVLLSVVAVCLVSFSSCKTTASAVKEKEVASSSAETANSKASLYHAVAEEVTKQCPIEVDELTTLTKLDYKEELHALAYTYLYSGSVYEELSAQKWAVVQKTAAEMLKEKLKTNQLAPQVRSDCIKLICIYKDKNDKELFSVTILPGEY